MDQRPKERRYVLCAACRRQHRDEGKAATCGHCGLMPLPSYDYPVNHAFHPLRCDCVVVAQPTAATPPRRTPLPTLDLKE